MSAKETGRLRSAVQAVYDRLVRPRLPRKIGVKSGVAVRDVPLLDATDEWRGFETPAVDAILTHVRNDDHVVVLGGGWGITPVHAARTGDHVTVFEAAADRADDVRETARLNHVGSSVEVRHAVVGEGGDVWGSADGADEVAPSELPECDVLEMDVEGAEATILPQLEIRPRLIIIEYHLEHGVAREWVTDQLAELGYRGIDHGVEDPNAAEVLTAVRDGE